jgi:sRNA-binding protein
MSKNTKKLAKERSLKVIDWLCAEYPKAFNLDEPKPLAIGTGNILLAALPEDIAKRDFNNAMRTYVHRARYVKAIIKQTHRFDLQGEPAEEISETDKDSAKIAIDAFNALRKAPTANTKIAKPKVVATDMTIEIEQQVEPVTEEKKTLSLKLKKKESTPPAEKPTSSTGTKAQAKSLKVTLVIDPATLPDMDTAGLKKVPLEIVIANGDLTATTEINSKSYRKALSSIAEYGAENCTAIIQGSMKQYGVIDDAGLVVQQKKVAATEAN